MYRDLKKNAVKGIIIVAFEPGRQELNLAWDEFCVVKIDSRHMQPAFTFVSNDQMHAVRLAFQKLRTLGCRRIGLAVGVNDEVATANLPTCGYLLEQTTGHDNQRVTPLFSPSDMGLAAAKRALSSWIQRASIDAVISNWTNIRRLLRAGGVRCPEEGACACMCLHQATPSLAGVVANLELVGSQVTRMLAALLRSEQYGVPETPTSTYVEGFWHDGGAAPPRV